MTSLLAHGIRLALVLRHTSVHMLDDIWADGHLEDLGEGSRSVGGRAIGADDADDRSGHDDAWSVET